MDQNQNQNYEPFGGTVDFQENASQKYSEGFAVASLVLGIIGTVCATVCCCCYLISGLLGVLAIVFAILSKKQTGNKLCGKAIAGLVLGIIAIVLFALWMTADAMLTAAFEGMTEAEIEQAIYEFFGIDPSEIPTGYTVTVPMIS